ncbi:efflux transporter outer membrane subunit [soil metagenome]
MNWRKNASLFPAHYSKEHFMKKMAIMPALVTLLALSACAPGPKYTKPVVSTPAKFHEDLSDKAGVSDLKTWWKQFNDPVLDGLIDQSVSANYDLLRATQRIDEARAMLGRERANYGPTGNMTGSYTKSSQSLTNRGTKHQLEPNKPVPVRIERRSHIYDAGFDANWELDVFGRVRKRAEAAKADLQALEEDRRFVLITLIGDVGRNYIELRGAQELFALTVKNLHTQEETLKLTRARFEAGLNTELDVSRSEAQVATTEAQIPGYREQIDLSIHRLSVLAGKEPGALFAELDQPAPMPVLPPATFAGLPSALLERRPDIRSAERNLAAQTARIGAAKADYFPRFILTGNWGLSASDLENMDRYDSQHYSFGPRIEWPILDAWRTKYNVKAARSREEQARADYHQTILLAFEEVENSLVTLQQQLNRGRILDRAVVANRRAVELAHELQSNGLVDFLSVLDTERELLASESARAQSQIDATSNMVTLYKSLGGGWETFEPLEDGKPASAAPVSTKPTASTP